MFSLLYAWATTVACICVLAVLVALVRAMSQAPRAPHARSERLVARRRWRCAGFW